MCEKKCENFDREYFRGEKGVSKMDEVGSFKFAFRIGIFRDLKGYDNGRLIDVRAPDEDTLITPYVD